MPKTRKQKEDALSDISEGLKSSKAVVFANFQGLSVAEADELRNLCRKEDVKVLVAKKTLFRKAFDKLGLEADPKLFEGGVASFFGQSDEIAPAKVVANFAKTHKVVSVFGGVFEGKFIGADYVNNLASLPSKQELYAKVVGSLNAPVSGFVNVLAGNLRGLVSVLNNIKEAKA